MSYAFVIDGGTTNLRVTLTDHAGQVLASEKRSVGAAASAMAGSNAALRAAVRDCIQSIYSRTGVCETQIERCIAYGMITSASGLLEVPHLCAPAGTEDLRNNLVEARFGDIAPFPFTFIPGVRNFSGAVDLNNLQQMKK